MCTFPPFTWRDRLPALALASMIVAFGLQPNWMARWSEHTTLALHEPYQAYVQAKLEQNYPGSDRLGAEAIAESYLLP
jgi:NADH:ubiquinone oxidoreductase subunit 4 (subunit M)